MRVRKRAIIVEAQQFTYTRNPRWEMAWPIHGVRGAKTFVEKLGDWWAGYPRYYTDTHEGTLRIRNGDWVIKGVKGEFYPCDQEIFEATYERLDSTAESN